MYSFVFRNLAVGIGIQNFPEGKIIEEREKIIR
jgi:hypothetical protein